MKKKKIIIFGGSGFLASNLADELSKKKYRVTIFDNRRSKYIKNNQKMIIGNILDTSKVLNACKNQDVIYHFAAVADIKEANKKHLNAIKINIYGLNIINLLWKTRQ